MNRLAARPGRNYRVYERIREGASVDVIATEFKITRGRVAQIRRWVEMKMAREPRQVFAQGDEIMGAL